jgi:squalene-hopene/tetraprenyl-beta-curcumene cyclase
VPADTSVQRAAAALDGAVGHLRSLQHAEGWWKGELETNVTMDAEDLLLRQFLGVLDPADAAATARFVRSRQRSDGTWANFYEGPADLSTTIEAYVALRLAGDAPEDDHMAKAAAFVRDAGGLPAARVFTRLWLALFGLWSWDELPALPPEVIFLPKWFPLNIYDFACWARQTIVALTVVAAHRPVRSLPFGIEELWPEASDDAPVEAAAGAGPAGPAGPPGHGAQVVVPGPQDLRPVASPPARRRPGLGAVLRATRRGRSEGLAEGFRALDRVLHGWERLAATPVVRRTVRAAALAAAERWIVRRQEADGGWGGIQPPWVYSLMALHLCGYTMDHPVLAKGFAGLESFTIREDGPDGETRRLEACQSPVWDTALAVIALDDAGVPPSDPAVARAGEWLVGEEVTVRGDWAVRRPQLEPGGWAFEFANDNYPDIDDTAEVVMALERAGLATDGSVLRGRRWVEGMVSRDGGWAAFDADNVRDLCRRLPFCDFGEVIDPPTADVTAHVLEMLAGFPDSAHPLVEGGVDWLTRSQEADGSWFGRWGANYVYGTGAVVPALVRAGVEVGDPRVRHAVAWLEAHQCEDGGWGEDMRSYRDPSSAGRGAPTASQTAWALLALIAAGEAAGAPARAGVRYLVETQRTDGTWDEPWYTGTGFPGDFSINYHLYRLVFPISALGRWVRAMRPAVT